MPLRRAGRLGCAWLAALPGLMFAGPPAEQVLHSTKTTVQEHETGATRTGP